MASGKPLTKFLVALCHTPELAQRYRDSESDSDQRRDLLAEFDLSEHELFANGEPTLDAVQAAVAAENPGASVGVTWWIWFFGGPAA